MLNRIVEKINRRLFLREAAKILDTPPIARRDASVVFFSMLQSKDVLPYLLSIKSVYHAFGQGRIAILNDGSLTEHDKRTLTTHLVDPQFFHIQDVDTGTCPTGNCWERLVTAIDLSKNDYIIQLDADIICTGPIKEVIGLWKEDYAFSLGNSTCPGIVTFQEMSRWILKMGWEQNNHVQIQVERRMQDLPNASTRKYARASAAFTGFPKGYFDRSDLELFSNDCRNLHGTRWDEWGTEQISSNYLIANSHNPHLLKPPTYINHTPALDLELAELIHFFGTYRYDKGHYKRTAQRAFAKWESEQGDNPPF